MEVSSSLFPAPPIGRRPVSAPHDPQTDPTAGENRPVVAAPAPGQSAEPCNAASRLLIGSHLLLLIQSLLILCSGIELGAARLGIAAISGVALAAIVWAAFVRFSARPASSGRRRDAA